eukprot:SAG31_NODE_409_length_16006_cov_10.345760_9_plen_118_part_00
MGWYQQRALGDRFRSLRPLSRIINAFWRATVSMLPHSHVVAWTLQVTVDGGTDIVFRTGEADKIAQAMSAAAMALATKAKEERKSAKQKKVLERSQVSPWHCGHNLAACPGKSVQKH